MRCGFRSARACVRRLQIDSCFRIRSEKKALPQKRQRTRMSSSPPCSERKFQSVCSWTEFGVTSSWSGRGRKFLLPSVCGDFTSFEETRNLFNHNLHDLWWITRLLLKNGFPHPPQRWLRGILLKSNGFWLTKAIGANSR